MTAPSAQVRRSTRGALDQDPMRLIIPRVIGAASISDRAHHPNAEASCSVRSIGAPRGAGSDSSEARASLSGSFSPRSRLGSALGRRKTNAAAAWFEPFFHATLSTMAVSMPRLLAASRAPDRLVEGKLVPGNPEESRVFRSLAEGIMPPGRFVRGGQHVAQPAPPELIERVGAFIARRASVLGPGLILCGLLGSGGCFFDDTPDWSPPTFVPREPEPPEPYADRAARLPPEWSEEEKVESLLSSYCGECHGPLPSSCPPAACDGLTWIDDIDKLVQEATIVPGRPDESPVIQMMVDGSMPPGMYPDAPPELIERVSAFIVSLCATRAGWCQADTDAGD